MTLVVARKVGERLSIAADTLITALDTKLPMQDWVLKSVCLPGGLCVSYCNSPDLAFRAFRTFRQDYPSGTGFAEVVNFFEGWSARNNNDFIVAFAQPARLITIRDGKRTSGVSRTHWIGDRAAYGRFRHYEDAANSLDMGRAVNAAMFADEMKGSPASELYSAMRHVVRDHSIMSVGGVVTVLSNREGHFRYSVYSDALFDWPRELSINIPFESSQKFDLAASGENDRYSVSQISSGYYDLNAAAIYYLKGNLLIVLSENDAGPLCTPISGVTPDRIAETLDRYFGFRFRALCLVVSARSGDKWPGGWRTGTTTAGVGLALFCEVNTMPKVPRL